VDNDYQTILTKARGKSIAANNEAQPFKGLSINKLMVWTIQMV